MAVELSPEQRAILDETRRFEQPDEVQAALAAARPEKERIFIEAEIAQPNVPAQALGTTLASLRALYLAVLENTPALAATYAAERRFFLRDAIRLLDTINEWFGEGTKSGAYRPRSNLQILAASRPWRARCKAIAEAAFPFRPKIAALFADVNSTRTREEEIGDLKAFLRNIKEHELQLRRFGLSDALVAQGQALLDEAEGKDLLGILGVQKREETRELRNRLLTYAVLLGREARAAGINALYDDPQQRARFEAVDLKSAMRLPYEPSKAEAETPSEAPSGEPKP